MSAALFLLVVAVPVGVVLGPMLLWISDKLKTSKAASRNSLRSAGSPYRFGALVTTSYEQHDSYEQHEKNGCLTAAGAAAKLEKSRQEKYKNVAALWLEQVQPEILRAIRDCEQWAFVRNLSQHERDILAKYATEELGYVVDQQMGSTTLTINIGPGDSIEGLTSPQ